MQNQENILFIVRLALSNILNIREKKMFGKIAFMVNDKLCIAVGKDEIMCRIDPSIHASAIMKEGCEPVIMKGKEMSGYVYIKNTFLEEERQCTYWINLCLEYNRIITR